MAKQYTDRAITMNSDGSPLSALELDKAREEKTRIAVEAAWSCQLHSFGHLCPIDWWAEQDGRMVGVLELKSRNHEIDTYPTVVLNVRKWIALSMASLGLAVPAIAAFRFLDESVRWIKLTQVDATRHRIMTSGQRWQTENDREPVIDIPIDRLKTLRIK